MGTNMRDFKFYREDEQRVMEYLGFTPTKNSGSGWIEKEDGESNTAIAQMKSTDKASIRIQQSDIRTLEKNASTSHKVPVFVLEFLNTGEIWVMAKPHDMVTVADGFREHVTPTKQVPEIMASAIWDDVKDDFDGMPFNGSNKPVVKSSSKARDKFHKDQERALESANEAYKAKLREIRRRR